MTASLTLEELLDQRDLGLELVSAPPGARSRRVAGAHSMEVCDPSRWLEPDWVMLTTGSRLLEAGELQRELVGDAHRGALAAIGFGVGVDFDALPDVMLEEADALGFPIFTVPFEVPFRAIVNFVNRSALSEHIFVMQRARGAQAYLLDSLSEVRPRETILRRVSELLSADAALFLYDGHLELAEGAPPDREVWDAVCSREPRLQDFDLGDLRVLSIPISRFGQRFEWLVVTSRRLNIHPQIARDVVRSSARLLGVVSQAVEGAAAERREARAELLGRLLEGTADSEAIRRAGHLGLDLADPVRLVVIQPWDDDAKEPSSNGSGGDDRCLRQLENALVDRHVPNLIARRGGEVVALVQGLVDGGAVEEWLERLAETGAPASAGVSAEVTDLGDVPRALRDASLALQRGVVEDRGRRAYSFEDFTLAEWLLSHAPAEEARRKTSLLLAPLNDHPELRETLDVHLRSNLNVKTSAQVLHLHPNSVRYRLDRVEQILGHSLDSVSSVVELYLALRADG